MSKRAQYGATLVVVLVLLVIVTLLGTMAIRQSLTSLNIATNSQAQSLLIQSSDTAFFRTEDATELARNMLSQGMFGYVRGDTNKGKELVFCFRPKVNTIFFDISKASVISWFSGTSPNNSELGTDGYCNVTVTNDFTSNRQAVVTQVTVKVADTTSTPFQFVQQGTDTESAKVDTMDRIVVYSTSIIPGLAPSSTTSVQINACFSNHMSDPKIPVGATADTDADDSVTDCLGKLNVPYSTQVTEYNLMQLISKCEVGTTGCTS